MIRVVRGSSLLLVSAIVAACAAHRDENQGDENQATAEVQRPQTQPVTQEVVAAAAKEEERKLADYDEARRLMHAQQQAQPQSTVPAGIALNKASALLAGSATMSPPYQQAQNTERYQHLDDNPVHLVAEQPISTFSIDVDTGAYANVRRFLNAGQLPPQDAVRVEEMVNYFDYSYVPPALYGDRKSVV